MKKENKEKKKNTKLFRNFGINHDRDYFVENLSMLVASGMPILEALSSVTKDISTKSMRDRIDEIRVDVESGYPLWKAIDRAGLFSEHTISLMRIGEDSGKLSANLRIIGLQEQKQRTFKSKIRSAMMYPLFVMGLTIFIGVGIAWFILPKLATVFGQLKLELPFITKALIGTGVFLGDNGLWVIPLVFIFIATVLFFTFIFKKTKFIGQSILFFIPGIKRLIQEIEIARLGYLLGTLLEAGLPVIDAINSLSKATQFPHYKKFYEYLAVSIEDGNSFEQSFIRYKKLGKLIPNPIQQLIIVGEKSGNLSKTLISISENFEEKTETTTKNLTVILEPILLVIVWVGVVSVALAVILPIYNLIGGLNKPRGQNSSNNSAQNAPSEVEEIATESPEQLASSTDESLSEVVSSVESKKVEIQQTGIGYLNVRSTPSTSGEIVGQVLPGDILEFSEVSNGWYKIKLDDETEGWIIDTYAKEIETTE